MNEKRNKHQLKTALRLALANVAFGNAEDLVTHILESNLEESSGIYQCSIAGIVVTYARPFQSANGLGPLEEFEKLPERLEPGNVPLQQLHDYMMTMRNALYAHTDMGKIQNLTCSSPDDLQVNEIELVFNDPAFIATTNEKVPPKANLNLIRVLLRYQQTRVQAKLDEHLRGALGKLPQYGRYKLTETGFIQL